MAEKITPKIRFKGFQDDWESHELGEMSERVQGNDGRMDLPTLTISAGGGWMDQRDRFYGNIAGNEQKNYTLLRKSELSYNHGNSKLAKYGTVFALKNYEEALVPRVYHSFKMAEEACPDYVEYMFASKLPDKELAKLISSGARMDGLLNISYDDFMSIRFCFPKKDEQEKIASILREIDILITQKQGKHEKLQNFKKSMLKKMFPKNGADVPEIRFEGFADTWEQRKLCELCDEFRSGEFIKASDITPSGDYPVYGGNGLRGYTNTYNHDGEYAIIGRQGALCGNMKYASGKAYFTEHAVAVKANGENVTSFLYHLFGIMNLGQYSGQSAQPGLAVNNLIELKTTVPDKAEQTKIAALFSAIDDLITLHQRELEKLKNFKKAMLERMFVLRQGGKNDV